MNKGWDELITLPNQKKEYPWLAKGQTISPITGCPNMIREPKCEEKWEECVNCGIGENGKECLSENSKIVGCRTPGTLCPNWNENLKSFSCYQNGDNCKDKGHCSEVDSVSYCYQAEMCNRFPDVHKPEYRFHPDRLEQLARWKKPRIISVGTSGDVFGWMKEKRQEILEVIFCCKERYHNFYLFLTQFPENYELVNYQISHIQYYAIGTTVTRKEQFDRIDILRKFQVSGYKYKPTKMIFLEPCFFTADEAKELDFTGIDWIIAGNLNHPNKKLEKKWYPEMQTIAWIIEKARRAGAAVFLKSGIRDDFLKWNNEKDKYQEFPEAIIAWAERRRKDENAGMYPPL